MKNLGALKTAGSKIFSLPVLAEKTLGVIGLGKKNYGTGRNAMDVSYGSERIVKIKPSGREPHR